MKPVQPRRLCHRGVVEAAGFLVEAELLGLPAARARILEAWRPGTAVERLGPWLLWLPPASARVEAERSPGAPLVRRAGALVAAPLDDDEWDALSPPRDAVVAVREGVASVHPIRERMPEDPTTWLALEGYEVQEVTALGAPAAAPAVEAPPALELRERLSGLLKPAAPELQEMEAVLRQLAGQSLTSEARPSLMRRFLEWLGRVVRSWREARAAREERTSRQVASRGALASGAAQRGARGAATSGATGAVGRGAEASGAAGAAGRGAEPSGAAPSGLAKLWAALRSLFGRAPGERLSESTGAGGAMPGDLSGDAPPPQRSWRNRLADALDRALLEFLRVSRLGRLIGRAQADYLARMMELFERGELDEALRHALPLSKEGALPDKPALSVPKPREDLSLRTAPKPPGPSTGIGLGGELMDELRRMYRRAFEELVRKDRIEEAAFILAELLHEDAEAVSFLEKHGRLQLAAELAEARNLPPGLVVRQWFLAGNVARAVRVARRTQAFGDAVQRLQVSEPKMAMSLRALWADTLASSGNYQGAVEVVWSHPELRPSTRPWLDRLVELGGVPGAGALARVLVLDADAFPDMRARAEALLDDDSRDRAPEREVFANALVREGALPVLQPLARAAVRALVRDRAQLGHGKSPAELEKLAAFAGDFALRTDLPELPKALPQGRPAGVVSEHTFDAHDAGTSPVLDAVVLPGGRVLVALGERGARLVTRDGRTVHTFDVPVHRLVVSTHGDRALALAPRGDATLLHRLDLLQGRAERWCEAKLDAFSPEYDGSLWFVSEKDGVFAVDALAKDFRALWRVDRLGGRVRALSGGAAGLAFIVDGEPPERWVYQSPELVLRRRTPLSVPDSEMPGEECRYGQEGSGLTAIVRPMAVRLQEETLFELLLHEGAAVKRKQVLVRGAPETPVVGSNFVAVPLRRAGVIEVMLMNAAAGGFAGRFRLQGAQRVGVRLSGSVLSLCDDAGRVVVFDLSRGALSHDLRL